MLEAAPILPPKSAAMLLTSGIVLTPGHEPLPAAAVKKFVRQGPSSVARPVAECVIPGYHTRTAALRRGAQRGCHIHLRLLKHNRQGRVKSFACLP